MEITSIRKSGAVDRQLGITDRIGGGATLVLRAPRPVDGPAVSALIDQCPPLDANSAYCNLLQCTHFAQSCIIAERQANVIGWISGYRLPTDTRRFFVWQVAVHPSARGEGLALKMLNVLLDRRSNADVEYLLTTITPANAASWAFFEGFARRCGVSLVKTPLFDERLHFAGAHETEWLAEVGPFQKFQANGGKAHEQPEPHEHTAGQGDL